MPSALLDPLIVHEELPGDVEQEVLVEEVHGAINKQNEGGKGFLGRHHMYTS